MSYNGIIPLWGTDSGSDGITWAQFQQLVQAIAGPGERLQQARAQASAVALTTGVVAQVVANPVTLTPGVWMVQGVVGFAGANATIDSVTAALNQVSASVGNPGNRCIPTNQSDACAVTVSDQPQAVMPAGHIAVLTPPVRVRVTLPSMGVYLNASATFSVDAVSAFGSIWADYVGA